MYSVNIDDLIVMVRNEIKAIWVDEPEDIYNIKNGYLGSEAGVYDQYFTPLVMLSGEIRALGIHIFADLFEFSKDERFDLEILKLMTKRMIQTDVGVVSFFGLKKYGIILANFNDLIDKIDSRNQYQSIIKEMFTLTNRYQMWLHQIFPWGFCIHMTKKSPEDYKNIYEKMIKMSLDS